MKFIFQTLTPIVISFAVISPCLFWCVVKYVFTLQTYSIFAANYDMEQNMLPVRENKLISLFLILLIRWYVDVVVK